MKFDPDIHRRRSIRLQAWNYASEGAYFVTICANERQCLFGEVKNQQMHLNQYGEIVRDEWNRSAQIRGEINLDEFVIMPNHFHGIVHITRNVGATGRSPLQGPRGPSKRSLGAFMAGFKSVVTKRINELRGTPRLPVWQRNYYEHIIRDEDDYFQICEYIINNPLKWHLDENNPKNVGACGGHVRATGRSPLRRAI